MGSSILASLSEAGGNDPFDLVSKPLPSHSLDHADRVERNPRLCIMQARGPKRGRSANLEHAEYTGLGVIAASFGTIRECRCGNPRPTPEFLAPPVIPLLYDWSVCCRPILKVTN